MPPRARRPRRGVTSLPRSEPPPPAAASMAFFGGGGRLCLRRLSVSLSLSLSCLFFQSASKKGSLDWLAALCARASPKGRIPRHQVEDAAQCELLLRGHGWRERAPSKDRRRRRRRRRVGTPPASPDGKLVFKPPPLLDLVPPKPHNEPTPFQTLFSPSLPPDPADKQDTDREREREREHPPTLASPALSLSTPARLARPRARALALAHDARGARRPLPRPHQARWRPSTEEVRPFFGLLCSSGGGGVPRAPSRLIV